MTDFPINVVALVDEAKAHKIKSYPQHVNRASNIGHPCLRYLTYCRTHWQEKRLHDLGLQRIFDLGNLFEQSVMEDLREAGLYVEEQQSTFYDELYKLSGHIDGKLPLNGRRYPIEIKSMSPFVWDKITNWQDFLGQKSPYLRSYPYQMMTYLLLNAEEMGLMFLKNKVSGELKQLDIPLDYDLGETVLQKCETINAHVEAKTLPERIDWEDPVCGQCSFLEPCYPGRDFGEGLRVIEDAELEAMLKKREELTKAFKDYQEVDAALKSAIKEKTGLVIGDWLITGKWCERKGFVMKDSRYWLPSIKKVVR